MDVYVLVGVHTGGGGSSCLILFIFSMITKIIFKFCKKRPCKYLLQSLIRRSEVPNKRIVSIALLGAFMPSSIFNVAGLI